MGSKKIYKMLQHWFPELAAQEIPSAEQRFKYPAFLAWLCVKMTQPQRCYVMHLDPQHYYENGLSCCALLQDHGIDVAEIQAVIRERSTPLFRHYEQHKQVIGRHCDLRSQVYGIVLQEISKLLKNLNYELLLLSASEYHWMAVPNQADEIDQFCRMFEKQFKHAHKNIEHYQLQNWSWST